MKRINLIILSVYCLISIQCKKEATLPFYMNSTFQTESTTSVERVRVFTKNGEIMDTQLIRSFIDRHTTQIGFPNHFLFGITSEPLDVSMQLKISFRENYTANVERYTYYYIPASLETHEANFITTSPEELLVTEVDSVSSINSTDACSGLMNSLLAYAPVANCYPINGSQQFCKWKYFFPVSIQNQQVTIPIINRLVVSDNTTPGFYCMYNIWAGTRNNYKQSIAGYLGANDTVAFQIKKAILRKL